MCIKRATPSDCVEYIYSRKGFTVSHDALWMQGLCGLGVGSLVRVSECASVPR